MSTFTDEVVRLCNSEYELFGNGSFKEYDEEVYRRVGEYWDSVALVPKYQVWKGYNGRSGVKLTFLSNGKIKKPVSKEDNKNQPWSAAFISWIARTAGAGDAFPYSPGHVTYIVQALKEAKSPSGGKFVARRHTQYTPKVGDLIACERRTDSDATFDTYVAHVQAGKYEAHCDFVVAVEQNQVVTIGGNVGHSVAKKIWPLNSQGRIGDHDPGSATSRVICVIETKL
jgi:hypothetical protein